MGMETAAVVLAGISVASTVGKMMMENKAADSKTQALDLQAKEQQIAFQQKTLANYDIMQKVLSSQTAAATVRGVALTSPSLNAIQRDTFNAGVKENRNLEIESSLADANVDIEKQNVKNSLYAQMFGDVSNFGMQAATFATKLPSTGG